MKLVLIGGTGRSGTSFVYRQLLKNNEAAGYQDFETGLFTAGISLIDVYDRYSQSYTPDRLRYACGVFKEFVLERFSPIVGMSEVEECLNDFFSGLYKDRLTKIPLLTCFQGRARSLFEALFSFAPGSNRILVEKTPHNILLYKKIKCIFPDSKIIHVIRDPRAIAESVVRQSWGPTEYKDAVIWVRLILEAWIEQYQQKYFDEDNCKCIRIEDLTLKYADEERDLRRFLNERLELLSLHANTDPLDGWRENVSDADFEFACFQLGHIMKYFSYKKEIIGSLEQAKSVERSIYKCPPVS